jgi:hypothetical protein
MSGSLERLFDCCYPAAVVLRSQPDVGAMMVGQLIAAAERSADGFLLGETSAVAEDLADVAAGRSDRLAEAAGILLAVAATGTAAWPERSMVAAQMLLDAGGDPDALVDWVRLGIEQLT